MRVLSPDEEVQYLTAAAKESIDLADVATIMLLQGPRPDEVMSLEQTQIDLRNRHFTIWDNSAEGQVKKCHRKLKMTDETFRILRGACRSRVSGCFHPPRMMARAQLFKKHMSGQLAERKTKKANTKEAAGLNADSTTCEL